VALLFKEKDSGSSYKVICSATKYFNHCTKLHTKSVGIFIIHIPHQSSPCISFKIFQHIKIQVVLNKAGVTSKAEVSTGAMLILMMAEN
jgi:hypothetical protein